MQFAGDPRALGRGREFGQVDLFAFQRFGSLARYPGVSGGMAHERAESGGGAEVDDRDHHAGRAVQPPHADHDIHRHQRGQRRGVAGQHRHA